METMLFALAEVPAVARQVLHTVGTGRVFALSGDLGAGKTTLVAAMCRQLGVDEAATSPTFSIVNSYATPAGPVYHLDCYRLESIHEALDAGLEDVFNGESVAVFVEWPAVIEPLLPPDVVHLHLAHHPGGHARILTLSTGHLSHS
ncbi:tRNA (adenosine(37)-N6)-threonylcarbamoyltransferase complex ATPase subunit type 1 TsaE [Neolewinella lacunae]|uniref:tRNA threonylcarbamoyladenosine biosynthesis protein TsaE n=1 Tax=Neolewinella lacunae TaxID=1517758 RepID=A0A923PLU1_9BACT|nr:tRNA (adenosine(37)-N6)-threonylcarbamoyltransferase complex ATPase subunit type 1 TsaE [Neolewinella lacunae]MBC6995789.1 tRNA (adenosine(37)-N6)-threonylcarbamoyltransferase complex ATPase subunit type 1 TsaE [Neolewinella lacunae]MDN3636518.1 tRNA (adenosine(37)-N6)-threonylcarbamoyltransferase complex ATPase subunit type 1 TsaE [Neolewinella lacunae]